MYRCVWMNSTSRFRVILGYLSSGIQTNALVPCRLTTWPSPFHTLSREHIIYFTFSSIWTLECFNNKYDLFHGKKNPFKASQEAVFSLCAAAAAAATASVVSANDWVAFVKGWRIKQRPDGSVSGVLDTVWNVGGKARWSYSNVNFYSGHFRNMRRDVEKTHSGAAQTSSTRRWVFVSTDRFVD